MSAVVPTAGKTGPSAHAAASTYVGQVRAKGLDLSTAQALVAEHWA